MVYPKTIPLSFKKRISLLNQKLTYEYIKTNSSTITKSFLWKCFVCYHFYASFAHRRKWNIYVQYVGAIFELLQLPSVATLFCLPLAWFILVYKKKVTWKQLFIPLFYCWELRSISLYFYIKKAGFQLLFLSILRYNSLVFLLKQHTSVDTFAHRFSIAGLLELNILPSLRVLFAVYCSRNHCAWTW